MDGNGARDNAVQVSTLLSIKTLVGRAYTYICTTALPAAAP